MPEAGLREFHREEVVECPRHNRTSPAAYGRENRVFTPGLTELVRSLPDFGCRALRGLHEVDQQRC